MTSWPLNVQNTLKIQRYIDTKIHFISQIIREIPLV